MRALPPHLRKQLETTVLAARRAAENAARAAIEGLGVFNDRRPEHLTPEQAALRNGLRAKWRQLGNDREQLVAECAYEQWHRLLFARFLAENDLLIHPKYRAPVTLSECQEYASEVGEPDAWFVAAHFASAILPGIFRLDDPCVRLRLAPEGRHALERAVEALPEETFLADDSLGWVYQFWQTDTKDAVNASERKIGGADLGPVTQLFTENYMVRFLLENSLGAWWAGRHPESQLLKDFDYLRFDEGGSPSAGTFGNWPNEVAEVTVMDPCCGSGHFLVEAFSMLWQMRAEEERLTPTEAQDAVLQDNLFGLELDSRCVQIAMFAVALQAWKAGQGWRQLPTPNIACSGAPVGASIADWKALAEGDDRLEEALGRLHTLFRDADTLGSLIDPRHTTEISDPTGLHRSTDDVEWSELAPLLMRAAQAEGKDPASAVFGADAAGLARAADFLSRRYVLTATNVPYLTIQSQTERLRDFLQRKYPDEALDLATAFVGRCRRFLRPGGTSAAVTPQGWSYQPTYAALRRKWWTTVDVQITALVGSGAFEGISGEVVSILLLIDSASAPEPDMRVVDVRSFPSSVAKASALKSTVVTTVNQLTQPANPDPRLIVDPRFGDFSLLSKLADSYYGIGTGDYGRFGRKFWEVLDSEVWVPQQSTVKLTTPYGGREHVMRWEGGRGALASYEGAFIRNVHIWGKAGVVVSLTGSLPATLYTGEPWDSNCATVIPKHPADLPAIWAFISSQEYAGLVRSIDQSLKVMNHTLLKVPFDVDRWREVAGANGPLPEPRSEDPTQWLFDGRPERSLATLQVAVARLTGYRWPEQSPDALERLADDDGIVCLPSVAGESPAADRLRELLCAAFGESWTTATIRTLLAEAASKKTNLDDWLRDEFFKQHCVLFQNRPFVWHISDGLRDGFSALVNYHRLDQKRLEKLAYSYLGKDWVERQRADARDEVPGADARLAAALQLQHKLEAILKGEEPHDIYVRWKPLHEQAMGWEPDLNDGVRLNIRPFVKAGVLRPFSPWPFQDTTWKKDRGKNPDGSERLNDLHFTLAEKRGARDRAGRR